MKHARETAGRIMVTTVPVVPEATRIREVEQLLRSKANEFQTINYIYVVNDRQELSGVLSIKELLRLPADELVASQMTRKLVTVRAHTDQERVAQLALKHGLKAIPVVTKEQTILGVVSSDKILGVLNQEHTEDVLRFAGVQSKTEGGNAAAVLLANSPLTHVRLRLPWLVIGLLGGVVAAVVVEWFEGTLANQLILAAFIPAVVYMADAVGSQTEMLFIRALSLEHNLLVRPYLQRELLVNFLLGLILSGLAFALSLFWLKSLLISTILGLSIFLTVWFTVIIAIVLPWFFHVRGHDPAIACGPLATVIRDIMSLFVYLGVAALLL